jgi:hypothetical protein
MNDVPNQSREVTKMIGLNGKLAILVLTFGCVSAFAQNTNAPVAGSPGCGDSNAKFEVKKVEGQHGAQPASGDALVYFIEDDSEYATVPARTTRAGLDGSWVGATHGDSFLTFSVAPGVHHLCASWEPGGMSFIPGKVAVSSFTAQAGSVYYFVVKNTLIRDPKIIHIDLNQVNGDEGQLLANGRALATFRQK